MLDDLSSPQFQYTLLIAAGVGLVLLLLPQSAVAQETASTVQVPDSVDALVDVRGMVCSNCARRMKSALEDVEGVDRATVLLEKQDVLLTLTDEKTPSEKTLREAVTSAGYEFRNATFAEKPPKERSGG